VCLWNIHGAAITKLKTHEHLLDLFQHVDIVVLTKTHHFPSDTFPVLPGFCYFDVAMPMTPQGVVQKHSGGIVLLVRETWANSTVVWKIARDGTRIWLHLGNVFQRPLFLCIVYATPQGSPYADRSLFEHICQEAEEAMNLSGVLLAGDFNARTGINTDFIDYSQLADVLLVPQAIKDTLPNNMLERQNRDIVTACWHREFLDLYRTIGLFILNGHTPGDILGEYTCLSNKGFSTVDYFLTTIDQLEGVKRLEVNYNEKCSAHKDAHFDHRPLVLTITQQWQPPHVQQKAIKHLPRFKYDIAKTSEFNRNVQHNIDVWASPDVLDAFDVQTTINMLQQCITQSAEEVFGNKQVALGKAIKHSHKPWFDIECCQTKSQFAKLSHAHPDRQVRLKQMKQLYKRKKCAYDVLKAKRLCVLAKVNPTTFWKWYRKHAKGVNGITNKALRDGSQ